ncbi:hypothetical protein SLA2020_429820 [Shorea laevis]
MKCLSCRKEYDSNDAGTCRECYEEASETEEELKRRIEDLKARRVFVPAYVPACGDFHRRFRSITERSVSFTNVVLEEAETKEDLNRRIENLEARVDFLSTTVRGLSYTDAVLLASDGLEDLPPIPIHANKVVLVSRSPVFKAIFENEMEESRSGTIKISDVSYEALCAFINYLYTAEATLDEQMAYELLVLAEKYQVQHLKADCEKLLVSKLNWDKSVMSYAFAHQQNAKLLGDAALSLITDNMGKFTEGEECVELLERDPGLVAKIFEAYHAKQDEICGARILREKKEV